MVLESTMICVDDSDFMRNGDFVPTRLAAVQDAVNIVCLSKTRSNPENNVGLLTLAGSEVLTTLTTDVSKLMSKLLSVHPHGEIKLMSGIRIAHLALKHRQGKNHKMRIVAFIGSPLGGVDNGEFVRLAKRLKKEKVNVDVISFGEDNQELLNAFVDTLNGKDGTGSHLVVVPPGPNLTDALVHSPILQSEDGAPVPGMGGGGYDYGMETDDPELALALRVSMEEQRARQEAEGRTGTTEASAEVSRATNEEHMLEQALAMSMDTGRPAGMTGGVPDFTAMSEEEQIAYAMQMSMQDHTSSAEGGGTEEVKPNVESMDIDEPGQAASSVADEGLADTEYLQQVLEGLPSNSPKKESSSSEKKPDVKKDGKKK